MANKQILYTFRGANQDITKSKHPFQFYYEAGHIRITSTSEQSTGSVTNEKGHKLVITIPDIDVNVTQNRLEYNNKFLYYNNNQEILEHIFNDDTPSNITISDNEIIGHSITRDGVILFTTNSNGIDCIWHLKDVIKSNYNLELLYLRNLGFTKNNPIQAIFNYENENLQKTYWVDGKHQIRFINITHDSIEDNIPLIEMPATSLNFVGSVKYSQPIIDSISGGGTHTSGMIQYAYNLFLLNGSQTKISPLSELVALDKGGNLGGGELNEIVGTSPVIKINNIDNRYTHIRIYAIKYTSYNQIPSISLIDERELDSNNITLLDDGSVIDTLSLEEFLFLGSSPIVPKHIETKDGRLFSSNISVKAFSLPDTFDFRAYSFKENTTTTKVLNDVTAVTNDANGEGLVTVNTNYNVPKKHSSVNINYDTYKYQYNSGILGGSGKLLSYEIQRDPLINEDITELKFFKDKEIYRIGIELYNELGQKSEPHWIADYKMPEGNLEGNYNTLKVTLNNTFTTLVNQYNIDNPDAKIIGYKILRADRKLKDRTILQQGAISSMLFQIKDQEYLKNHDNPDPNLYTDEALKIPTYLIRHYQNYPNIGGNNQIPGTKGGVLVRSTQNINVSAVEIYVAKQPGSKLQYTFIHDKIMQLYSPELIFDDYSDLANGLKVSVKGMANLSKDSDNLDQAYSWIEERNIETKKEKYGGKIKGAINYYRRSATGGILLSSNNIDAAAKTPARNSGSDGPFAEYGFINPSGNNETMNFRLFYREYGSYSPAVVNYEETIYGKPEIVERGQGSTVYNNDNKYRYTNSLQSLLSDGHSDDSIVAISNSNSYGARNITFVLGNNTNIPTNQRTGSRDLFDKSRVIERANCNGEGILICEIKKPRVLEYLGNIYGGNSYEDKKRTEYIQIGSYQEVSQLNNTVLSPGDTFVQDFKLLRVGKTDVEVYSNDSIQLTDIIKFKVETTIDLKNRNDNSFGDWDNIFQPRYDDYNKYNKVYSQNSLLIRNQSPDYKFNEIKDFKTRVQATKLKIPNETIDSWTDLLENEFMDLDNKYGAINGLVSYKDKLYTFQDEGIALLSINPKVQIQSQDGIGIELGSGGILDDYNYLTTKSGSINKWGIVAGKRGIYYYDALNKAIGRVPDYVEFFLSDVKGMHSFYNKNQIYHQIAKDNPLIKQGALFGVDNYNKDIYFSLLQSSFGERRRQEDSQQNIINYSTWCFNELVDEFIDLKPGYASPTMYINKGDKLISIPDNKKLYEHHAGEYNKFWDEYSPSYITLMLNPESNYECVFNNIHYNSEMYLNDIDQPDKTLTHIRAYNEYQDSGRIPLIVGRGSNIRRKFREWQADIPRQGRDRIRNTWIYLKLELDNTSDYKMILHDILIKYSI